MAGGHPRAGDLQGLIYAVVVDFDGLTTVAYGVPQVE
jgi:hypothetical protein